jgi:hypothetical protein
MLITRQKILANSGKALAVALIFIKEIRFLTN